MKVLEIGAKRLPILEDERWRERKAPDINIGSGAFGHPFQETFAHELKFSDVFLSTPEEVKKPSLKPKRIQLGRGSRLLLKPSRVRFKNFKKTVLLFPEETIGTLLNPPKDELEPLPKPLLEIVEQLGFHPEHPKGCQCVAVPEGHVRGFRIGRFRGLEPLLPAPQNPVGPIAKALVSLSLGHAGAHDRGE